MTETKIQKPQLRKRRPIPAAVRSMVWERDCDNTHKIKCPICNINFITEKSSYCCHIIAWINGGSDESSNLVSGCKVCNDEMHDTDMDDYIREKYPTDRKRLELEIEAGERYIEETKLIINENREELKTLPSNPKIWDFVEKARKIYEENNVSNKKIDIIIKPKMDNITKFIEIAKDHKINRKAIMDVIDKILKDNEQIPSDKAIEIAKSMLEIRSENKDAMWKRYFKFYTDVIIKDNIEYFVRKEQLLTPNIEDNSQRELFKKLFDDIIDKLGSGFHYNLYQRRVVLYRDEWKNKNPSERSSSVSNVHIIIGEPYKNNEYYMLLAIDKSKNRDLILEKLSKTDISRLKEYKNNNEIIYSKKLDNILNPELYEKTRNDIIRSIIEISGYVDEVHKFFR